MTETRAMRYRIRHSTDYRYSDNVAVCQNQLRMQPISRGALTCHQTQLQITPRPTTSEQHFDYFGNCVRTFSIERAHQALSVFVESDVTVATDEWEPGDSPSWDRLLTGDAWPQPLLDEYRYASPRIKPSSAFGGYARESFFPGRGMLEASLELTQRIKEDFAYDTTATNVETTTERAFELKAGVCQDFAHVQIACLRSLGLPARYVSGYLRTVPPPGKEKLVGADESHAWLEVFAGDEMGWIGLDPTNACSVGVDHIPICIGRDYDDVSPMRGVVLGGGTNTLEVSVDVESVSGNTGDSASNTGDSASNTGDSASNT